MFQRLRIWLTGSSGLKEATREAAREATREGLAEGFRLGVEDFIGQLTGIEHRQEPKPIEPSNGNGHHQSAENDPAWPLSASELRGLRKPELLSLATRRGIDATEDWTVVQLKEELINAGTPD